jgi:RHH-type proline utilization regulon transcriptional repressor/proline dehydrogenase/delta 1-pyrroline-5-carboxylate dehydrogenase
MLNEINREIIETGKNIFQAMEDESQSIFNKDWWYGRIMDWSMKNQDFKVKMFRFVDVLPYLNSSSEVTKHLKEYFSDENGDLPKIFGFGLGLGSLAPGLLSGAIKKNVTEMAKMFITGENAEEALTVLKKARKQKLGFTVDILGEATLSEKEALEYQEKYLHLLEWLSQDTKNWTAEPQLDQDQWGDIPKVNVSVKLSSLYSQIKTQAWEDSVQILCERLAPIFDAAMKNKVFINLDMENYDLKDLTLDVFKRMIMKPEYKDYPHWGIVIQAYLRDSHADTQMLSEFAKKRGVPFTVRLVKGAYWDFETIISDQRHWPIPVYTNKKESDANYENCTETLLKNHKYIKAAFGSHNVRSIATAIVISQKLNLPKSAFEIQMLYGMAEPIKKSLVRMGYRVREYAPVGELIPGMAYLVRRLLENTSNESFLKSKFADNASTESLLVSPHENLETTLASKESVGFYNEPLLDFTLKDNREKMLSQIQKIKTDKPKTYPVVINGKEIKTATTISTLNPASPANVLALVTAATLQEAELAVATAHNAYASWSKTPANKRADLVDKLADIMLKRRFELNAIEVLETGKPWIEADGDITEAIDFCRYYANHMRDLTKPQRAGHVAGELSLYHYQPRGVCLVIAPWNFPLAILTGMVASALVTGNTVVMKPAEQSSLIGAKLMEMILEAGFPKDTVSFLPGIGEEIGPFLVEHPKVEIIAFTGSKTVGLDILKKSSEVRAGQKGIKKCIIEMGGKNAMIIDSDADLDEAVSAVVYSAFGFQGQKCSALSRAIVLEDIYERFLERLVEAAGSIKVLPPENPQCFVGPVIDKDAYDRIMNTIEAAKKTSKLSFQSTVPGDGYFVPPTIFSDVDPKSSLAQNEIFGPVLAVIKAKDIDQALKIANDTEYGLTGGLFSRSPANIEKIKNELEVGNLYINRTITGAMVERHPFGGFKMSGVGSKTGGPDYLRQFMEPRVITENTMRRGFAPTE